MTVSIGGMALSDDLVLDGLETSRPAAVSVRKTLGLKTVVRSLAGETTGGRLLTLSGEYHFTLAELSAIRDLQATGSALSLVHHRGTFTVVILAIEAEPATVYANPGSDAWYSATITLQEL